MRKLKPMAFGSLVLLAFVVGVAFQNCSAGFSFDQAVESSITKLDRDTSFDYPYSSKPDFYTHLALYRHASEIESLSEFTIIGAAAYIDDPTQTVSYTVTVKSEDGAVLCPTQSGSLIAGVSAIEFDCTAPVTDQNAKVLLSVAAAGKTATLERSY